MCPIQDGASDEAGVVVSRDMAAAGQGEPARPRRELIVEASEARQRQRLTTAAPLLVNDGVDADPPRHMVRRVLFGQACVTSTIPLDRGLLWHG